MKYLMLCFFGVIFSSSAANLSDVQAKIIAQQSLSTIAKVDKDLKEVLKLNDADGFIKFVDKPLTRSIDEWPAMHLSNRASFPYYECKQMLIDYKNLAWTFGVKDGLQNRRNRDAFTASYRKSMAGCKQAIKQPDMSLKDIQ